MASLKYTVDVDTKGARSSISSLERSLSGIGAAVAGAFAVGEIVGFGDSIIGLQNKLRSLTGDQALVSSMFKDITNIAGAARAPLRETGDLYFRIARAAKDLGITQQETADITQSLAKSMSMTGMTAQESAGALLQLGQALQSGRFQGDELRSVLENMPIVSKAMADELGVTIGQLRKLGSEGKITSDIFVRAMQKNKKSIDDAFARSVPTAVQALNNLKTASAIAFNQMATEPGPAKVFVDAAKSVLQFTNDVNKLASTLKTLFSIFLNVGLIFAAIKALDIVKLGFKEFASLLTGSTSKVTTGVKELGGAAQKSGSMIRGAFTGMGDEISRLGSAFNGLKSAFGKAGDDSGKLMKGLKADATVLTSLFTRFNQIILSSGNIISKVLSIGLRFAGWVGVFFAIIDVINLLNKVIFKTDKNLIDLGRTFGDIIHVVKVVALNIVYVAKKAWELVTAFGAVTKIAWKVVGGVEGIAKSFLSLYGLTDLFNSMANAWNNWLSAISNYGPIQAASQQLYRLSIGATELWNNMRRIAGDFKAPPGRNRGSKPGSRDRTIAEDISLRANPKYGLPLPPIDTPFTKTGIPRSAPPLDDKKAKADEAKKKAEDQAKALRDVRDAILEITKAYREGAKARLDDLQFQLKSINMSEDQIAIETQRRDIIKEQTDAVKGLVDKVKEVEDAFKNEEITAKGREEALALIAKQKLAIESASAAEIAAADAAIKKIQKRNIELDAGIKKTELLQQANENRAALQALEDQLTLVGLYGDALDDTTAQLELQQKIREINLQYENQLLDLEKEKTKLGKERFANELANLQAVRTAQTQAANDQAAAQKRIDDARKKSERTDVKGTIAKRLEEIKRSVDPTIIALEQMNNVFDRMGSAIDNFVDTGKFKFADFARSIIADIAKIHLKAAATKILSSIFGSMFKLPGLAAGGPAMAGKPYIVGEQGPELFVPNSAGSIMTNASLNRNEGLGQSTQPVVNNTYITNNISAIDSRSVAQMFVENRKALFGASMMARKELPYGS